MLRQIIKLTNFLFNKDLQFQENDSLT